jgi:hypothetical protein
MEKTRAPHPPLVCRSSEPGTGLDSQTLPYVTVVTTRKADWLSPARAAAIAATTTAVASVTAVATATAIAASVTAEATATAATAAAAARPAAFATLMGWVYPERATVEHLPVHGIGCSLRLAFGSVFNESKSARSAGFTIDDH